MQKFAALAFLSLLSFHSVANESWQECAKSFLADTKSTCALALNPDEFIEFHQVVIQSIFSYRNAKILAAAAALLDNYIEKILDESSRNDSKFFEICRTNPEKAGLDTCWKRCILFDLKIFDIEATLSDDKIESPVPQWVGCDGMQKFANYRDAQGNTPLHYLYQLGQAHLLPLFIKPPLLAFFNRGRDAQSFQVLENQHGVSPIDLAEKYGYFSDAIKMSEYSQQSFLWQIKPRLQRIIYDKGEWKADRIDWGIFIVLWIISIVQIALVLRLLFRNRKKIESSK